MQLSRSSVGHLSRMWIIKMWLPKVRSFLQAMWYLPNGPDQGSPGTSTGGQKKKEQDYATVT
jgi:hypothetical protein